MIFVVAQQRNESSADKAIAREQRLLVNILLINGKKFFGKNNVGQNSHMMVLSLSYITQRHTLVI